MSTINVNTIQTAGGLSPVLVADIATQADIDASKASFADAGASALIGHTPYGAAANTVEAELRSQWLRSRPNPDSGYIGLVQSLSSTLVLGDSITEGAGAASYVSGYAYQVARSLINSEDFGYQKDSGFGWHCDINQANAVNTGLSTTGTVSATGLVANRRTLAAGQSITVTGRAFETAYAVYDGALSTGSLVFARNGVTLSTQAVSGSVIKETAAVNAKWVETDTLTITASGGTVVICGVLTLKTASNANLLYVAGKSGYAYQDYTTTAAMDEIGYWLNLFRSSATKLLVLQLGTNNLYNAGRAKTPALMVAEISALIAGVNARCSSVKYVISVPPKANEGIFPIIQSGYSYQDYVVALVTFAEASGHGLIRNDLSILSRSTSYYADGVHPDGVGHRIVAATLCDALGIRLNSYTKTSPIVSDQSVAKADIAMNGTWGAYTGDTNLKAIAHTVGNTVSLSGIVQPNGSASTTLGTLPVGYWPIGRTCYLIGRSDAGAVGLSINVTGQVILSAVPATWFSLEGISFQVSR